MVEWGKRPRMERRVGEVWRVKARPRQDVCQVGTGGPASRATYTSPQRRLGIRTLGPLSRDSRRRNKNGQPETLCGAGKRENVQVHGPIGKKGRPGLTTRDNGWRERDRERERRKEPDAGRQLFFPFPVQVATRFSYDRYLDDGARPSVETVLNPTRYPRSRKARVPTAARARVHFLDENYDDDDRKAL
ncbi:hypothetical protein BDP55DRAFT_625818 [Colletotrichum godetiae]|uniref:Uncharacterized protein n=1 Tax=Colletotrichum godetiae TaxID=1209918 RepID=A0AAJ0F490_9PEZI|nr:uncharacterized protein BDP55DRAFT_625818 [Colletotrichum godetiae]KAK1700215.1 hypothetical protein BDP55DRAFT_625818 [Colletotrichum godetiae]